MDGGDKMWAVGKESCWAIIIEVPIDGITNEALWWFCSLAESDPIGQLSSLDVCNRIGAEQIVSIDRQV